MDGWLVFGIAFGYLGIDFSFLNEPNMDDLAVATE